MVDIGMDEGILGNDIAMSYALKGMDWGKEVDKLKWT